MVIVLESRKNASHLEYL